MDPGMTDKASSIIEMTEEALPIADVTELAVAASEDASELSSLMPVAGYSSGPESGDEKDDAAESAAESGCRRRKRRLLDNATCRPFKRQRDIFSADYLELLNKDVDDAANKVCLDEEFNLPCTQIGLTTWSSLEKKLFFEALARLGRHDLPGIASRVGTKAVIEIRHFISFLQDALALRRLSDQCSSLETSEIPAAAELSQQCCHALEAAADDLSLRQEQQEARHEAQKWGPYWNMTVSTVLTFDRDPDTDDEKSPAFAQMFHLGKWLELSERLFMNSSVPAGNWQFVGDGPPSIWATSFDDFYSLMVSITRRLVQATLFISMSRIRAKKEADARTKDIVWRKDAQAAILSLGMPLNVRHFWLKSARRLRLHVFAGPPDRDEKCSVEGKEASMAYDDVEHALGEERDGHTVQQDETDQDCLSSEEDTSSEDTSGEEDISGEENEKELSPEDEEQRELRREANEAFLFSAFDLPEVSSARQQLEKQIAAERMQEKQAESYDQCTSYHEEAEMWRLLQKTPPEDRPKHDDAGQLHRSNLGVGSAYLAGTDWTASLHYRSEWKTQD